MKKAAALLIQIVFMSPLVVTAQTREPAAAKAQVVPSPGPTLPIELVKRKARYREYPGGRDEEPLKLSPQLNNPIRTHTPGAEGLGPEDEAND